VNVTTELDKFVATRIAGGRYENASEVLRTALRAAQKHEKHGIF
jgi:putative addiction module CopG family antidote